MTDETTTEQLVEIEGQAESTPATEYTPPEGWRVLRSGELLQLGDQWVNWEGTESRPDILHGDGTTASGGRYIRRIKPEPQQVNDWPSVRDLRHELKTVQTLLGESRQRVTQLEELVTSLRTINEGAEKAVSGAGVVNDSLRLQLAAVKAELASVAADRQRLQIELDAAQQVPAAIVDRFQEGWNQGTARAVETIAEWLQPVQAAIAAPDNVDESTRAGWFAEEVIQHLPSIMRSLTGLDSPEDVD